MALLESVEQKRRWTEIHDLLSDLLINQGKLDALTDLFYKLIWDEGEKPDEISQKTQEHREPRAAETGKSG